MSLWFLSANWSNLSTCVLRQMWLCSPRTICLSWINEMSGRRTTWSSKERRSNTQRIRRRISVPFVCVWCMHSTEASVETLLCRAYKGMGTMTFWAISETRLSCKWLIKSTVSSTNLTLLCLSFSFWSDRVHCHHLNNYPLIQLAVSQWKWLSLYDYDSLSMH